MERQGQEGEDAERHRGKGGRESGGRLIDATYPGIIFFRIFRVLVLLVPGAAGLPWMVRLVRLRCDINHGQGKRRVRDRARERDREKYVGANHKQRAKMGIPTETTPTPLPVNSSQRFIGRFNTGDVHFMNYSNSTLKWAVQSSLEFQPRAPREQSLPDGHWCWRPHPDHQR